MQTNKNIFATVLTYPAPSANYRGEREESRNVLQTINKGGHEYPVVSPEAMRNALREILTGYGLPMNRRRIRDLSQLAVEYKSFPDDKIYADDFLFGFFVMDHKVMKERGEAAKRDSVLRMNLAVALAPTQHNATLHQSPVNAGASPWQNSTKSALIQKEVAYTAFQYPFALALRDCAEGKGPDWTRALLRAVGELSRVGGGHARSYYEMAPRSIVVRFTTSLVAGFSTYGFAEDASFPELSRVHAGDLPGQEFWIGGELVRNLSAPERKRLAKEGVQLFDNPQTLLGELAAAAFRRGKA